MSDISESVYNQLERLAHIFLLRAQKDINDFTSILGTDNPSHLQNILFKYFQTTNEGQWTPEMVEILKTCVRSEDYTKDLKNYVNVYLRHTIPSPFTQ
jgi:hypothetical protein